MHEVNLGQLITDPAQQRDAIHIAVASVVAAMELQAGDELEFAKACDTMYVRKSIHKPIGIVDPFLKTVIQPEDRFWMFLMPNTITSLRHDWTHPAFAVPVADKAASEKWMADYASCHYSSDDDGYAGWCGKYTAEQVIEFAKDFLLNGDRHVQQGSESLRDDTNAAEFWRHFEVITGMKVPDYHQSTVPFCCTC